MLTRSSPCINVTETTNKMEPSFYEWTSLHTCWTLFINFFQYPWGEKNLHISFFSGHFPDRTSFTFCEFHSLVRPMLRKWMNESPSIQLWIFCSWSTLSCMWICHQGWIKILTGSYSLISTMNNDLTLSAISETFPLTFFMLNWTDLKAGTGTWEEVRNTSNVDGCCPTGTKANGFNTECRTNTQAHTWPVILITVFHS